MKERENRLYSAFGLVVLCAVLLALAGVCSCADNIVQNPSFENFTAGTTYTYAQDVWVDTWRFWGGGTTAGGSLNIITPGQDGDVALELARTSTSGDSGVHSDDIPVEELKSYCVTVWVKSATSAKLRLTVASFVGSRAGQHLGDTTSYIIPSATWKRYMLAYTAPANTDVVNISFRSQSATGTICIDNVSMEETNELFPDPSFDNFTLGATYSSETFINTFRFFGSSENGGTMTVVSGRDTNGTAIQLSRTSESGDTGLGTWTLIPVTAGHTYRLMGWAKSDAGTPLKFTVSSWNSLGIYAPNNAGWLGDTVNNVYSTSPKWGLCAAVYTAPANCVNAMVSFRVPTVGSVTFDDVSLVDEENLTGNLCPDPSFDSFVLGNTYTTETRISAFGFFAVDGSGGAMTIVDGQDTGGTAIQLSRVAADLPDTGFGIVPSKARIPVKYGHVYNVKCWAKSSTGTHLMRISRAGYLADASTWFEDDDKFYTPGTDWTECSDVYSPSSSSIAYLNPGFRVLDANSDVTFDNVEITDITSTYQGTLTGAVTNALTGAVIEGATVSIDSDDTLTATTDASGVYTISNVPSGSCDLTVSASGYKKTSVLNVGVAVTSTKNVGIMPADTTWSVYDTFTRDDTEPGEGSSLGTTEDVYAIPWVKRTAHSTSWSGNTNSFIYENAMNTCYASSNYGTDSCAVSLGRSFMPADFDLSVSMDWSDVNGYWSGIAYRQSQPVAMSEGYFVKFSYDGQYVYLQYNGNTIATSNLLSPTYPSWQDATIRLVVCGDNHKVYVNNTLVIDATHDTNTGAGYIGLFCDTAGWVAWDNLSVNAIPDGMITGCVLDSVTGDAISGATVTVASTGDSILTDEYGIYSMSLAPATYTLTASANGYLPKTVEESVVTSSNTTTVDFLLDLAYTNVDTVIDAKALTDGTTVKIGESLVATVASTSFSDGSYYVENADRAYGIKVLSDSAVSEGSRVISLAGTIRTDTNGERYIDADEMTVTSGDALGALGMTNKSAVESLAQGMLVKVWGNVTAVASDKSYFYVNDGSNVDDGTGNVGIRVDYSNSAVQRLAPIEVGESVAITGVMGLGKNGTTTIKVIRPKTSLGVANTVINEVTVASSDTSWICQFTEGYGSVAFATAPDSQYGSGAVLMTEPATGDSSAVINLRTNLHAGLPLADITELSISNYMTCFGGSAIGIGARMSVNLDDIPDNSDYGGDVDDIITCDQWYNEYCRSLCVLNQWVSFDALNAGKWYSAQKLAGSSDAGPWISLAAYIAACPNAKIATVSNGGLRFFMGGSSPHWDNATGYIDNVRVGTADGTTVYNFEP